MSDFSASRRRFLTALAIGGGLLAAHGWGRPREAQAFGPRSLFTMSCLKYQGPYDKRLGAPPRLLWELSKRTSVETRLETRVVALSDPTLFDAPFLYMTGDGPFTPFSAEERARLKRFLAYGGFLFIDGNSEYGAGFDQSVRHELAALFPEAPLAPLPTDHTVFKSFYLLDGRWGRLDKQSYLEGIRIDRRTPLIYSPNDLGGAYLRDDFGNWSLPVTPGGDTQREMAFRLGVNIVMYALCTDYKNDQVHIPFILKRSRR